MKKIQQILLAILVASNLFLGYQVYQLKNDTNKSSITNDGEQQVNNVVTSFDTDITKVVEEVESKVVSVIRMNNRSQTGSGSGVIYKQEGDKTFVVTNHHVIENGTEIVVRFSSGEEEEAKVVGSDPYSDLALLEIKGIENVKPFKLGDSSKSKVGEFVIAIGSPLGVEFSNSTTFGIISGKDRKLAVDVNGNGASDWEMVVMQTDAAINPGNSGGALVNMAGELIGINSLKISKSNVEGMGFSIPINEVIPLVEQLEQYGEVRYPIIGISAVALNDVNPFYKIQYGIKDKQTGVLVVELTRNGPAAKAGIKTNDIITKFDDTEVETFKDFRRSLYTKKKGDKVVLEILRGEVTEKIEVTLE